MSLDDRLLCSSPPNASSRFLPIVLGQYASLTTPSSIPPQQAPPPPSRSNEAVFEDGRGSPTTSDALTFSSPRGSSEDGEERRSSLDAIVGVRGGDREKRSFRAGDEMGEEEVIVTPAIETEGELNRTELDRLDRGKTQGIMTDESGGVVFFDHEKEPSADVRKVMRIPQPNDHQSVLLPPQPIASSTNTVRPTSRSPRRGSRQTTPNEMPSSSMIHSGDRLARTSFTDTPMVLSDQDQPSHLSNAANRLLRALSSDGTGSIINASTSFPSPSKAATQLGTPGKTATQSQSQSQTDASSSSSPPKSTYRKLNSMDPLVVNPVARAGDPSVTTTSTPSPLVPNTTNTHRHSSPPSSPHRRVRERTTTTPAEDVVLKFRQESGDGLDSDSDRFGAGEITMGDPLQRDPTGRFRSETYQTFGQQSCMGSPAMGETPRGRSYTKQSQENLFGESPYSTTSTSSPGTATLGASRLSRERAAYDPDRQHASRVPLVKRLVSSKPLALSFNMARHSRHTLHRRSSAKADDAPLSDTPPTTAGRTPAATPPRSRQRSVDSSSEPTGLGMGSSPYSSLSASRTGFQASWPNVVDGHSGPGIFVPIMMPEPPTTFLDKLVTAGPTMALSTYSGSDQQPRRQSDWQAYQKKKDFLANESDEQRRRREKERVQVWSAWAVACIAAQGAAAPQQHRLKFPVGQKDSLEVDAHIMKGSDEIDQRQIAQIAAVNGIASRPSIVPRDSLRRLSSLSSGPQLALHSNPFLAIRSRTANASVRSLIIEMIVSLAALVDARELVYGETIPLNVVAKDLKRNRSSALVMLRAERALNPSLEEPGQEDLAFQESEFAALVGDLSDCIGHSNQVSQILSSGSYGVKLAPFQISSADGALRLLIDLEETIWGSADPSATELPGSFGPIFSPDGSSSQSNTPGIYPTYVAERLLAARDAAPENNLDDLLDVLNTAPIPPRVPSRGPDSSGYFGGSHAIGKLDFSALDLVQPAAVGPESEGEAFTPAGAITSRARRSTEPIILPVLPSSRTPFKALSVMEEEIHLPPKAESKADAALKEIGRLRYEAWKASREMQPLWSKDKDSRRSQTP